MGTVYEARHRNGKRVAIKTLHPELAHQADLLQRFFREGHMANTVDHPGVVSVLDDGTTSNGVPYLVMEFLEGEDLDARIMRLGAPLPLEDALSIAVTVLDILAAAHEKGIVHRDIKPNNVFLTGDGQVKILDFGIARLRDAKGYMATMSGVTVGTPTFMSREQAHGRHDLVDGQSDVWSFGATLDFALTGDFLYQAESTVAFLAQLMTQEPRPLNRVAPWVPRPIAAVVDRALHHDKSRRWASAREMRVALQEAAAACGVVIPDRPALAGYVPPPRPPGPSIPEFPPEEASSRGVRFSREISILPPQPRPKFASLPIVDGVAMPSAAAISNPAASPPSPSVVAAPQPASIPPPAPPTSYPPPASPVNNSVRWAAVGGGLLGGGALLGVILWAAVGSHGKTMDAPQSLASSALPAGWTPAPSNSAAPAASAPASAAPASSAAPSTDPVRQTSSKERDKDTRRPDRTKPAAGGERDLGNSRFLAKHRTEVPVHLPCPKARFPPG